MLFPYMQVPFLGDGMAIGLVAVIHVILSHGLAIGLVTIIVVLEHLALRRGDRELESLAQGLLKPAVVVITAVGAVTGAGIWFTVSVLVPGGIGSLLRVFFWPWFVEWVAFTLEVVVLLPYYFLWNRMREQAPGKHLALGWAYVVISFSSAFLISGILGFMLTPDGWVQNQRLLAAFFNPTFWPQLALRFFGGQALGAIFCLAFLLFSRRVDPALRARAARLCGGWLLGAAALCALCTWAYFRQVPATYATHATFAVLTSRLSQQPWILPLANWLAAALILALGLAALARGKWAARLLLLPALLMALGLVAEFERVREFIRGPYLMPGYMYANQITLAESAYLSKKGFLAQASWYENQPAGVKPRDPAGHALFAANCGVCHTIGGLNDIRDRVAGRTQPAIAVLVGRASQMVPFMPPFSGTLAERHTLAAYLYAISAGQRSPAAAPPAAVNHPQASRGAKGGGHE